MASIAIRKLVAHIQECEGTKGNAEAALKELRDSVALAAGKYDPKSGDCESDAFFAYLDLCYLEGYLATPAAVIADAKFANRNLHPDEVVKSKRPSRKS